MVSNMVSNNKDGPSALSRPAARAALTVAALLSYLRPLAPTHKPKLIGQKRSRT
ncbi:hypothetical protein ACJBU6_06405 [Exserohilum turcicum]